MVQQETRKERRQYEKEKRMENNKIVAEQQLKDKMLTVFNEGDYWKTVSEISSKVSAKLTDVVRILQESGDFVRSSYRSKAGLPVYTTRNLYRENAPVIERLLGAFKNRID